MIGGASLRQIETLNLGIWLKHYLMLSYRHASSLRRKLKKSLKIGFSLVSYHWGQEHCRKIGEQVILTGLTVLGQLACLSSEVCEIYCWTIDKSLARFAFVMLRIPNSKLKVRYYLYNNNIFSAIIHQSLVNTRFRFYDPHDWKNK